MTWGWGGCGQLGHGDLADCDHPEIVQFLRSKNPSKLSCGAAHTACILEFPVEGTLYVWGTAASYTSLATPGLHLPTPQAAVLPSKITSEGGQNDPIVDVACGAMNTLAMAQSGLIHILGVLPSSIVERTLNYVDKGAISICAGGRHFGMLVGRKWILDEDTDKCMKCSVLFNYIIRGRHHCRSCGGIYCNNCTTKRAPVLKFGSHAKVRVCDECFGQITKGVPGVV